MIIAEQLINEGIEKGMEKGITEVAEKMLMKDMSVDEVVELTGLSKSEVQKLKQREN